ncbi:MAG: TonB-dependent receptor [Balneolaceae bacterium]|nr:MAG: TonB-dependent receptor [Balneolaceae bacterium]
MRSFFFKRWLGPRIRAVSTQNRVAVNEDPTNGYILLGLNAGYHFKPNFSLAFRVDNLLNTSYRDHLSRIEERNNPMPARNFNAMLRWDF